MGTGSLCRSAGACGNAARWGLEKIRAVRPFTPSRADAAGGRALLDDFARRVVARQHHLCRTGNDRTEATRLDAGLFQRNAHGLRFSRDRQL